MNIQAQRYDEPEALAISYSIDGEKWLINGRLLVLISRRPSWNGV